jgi:rhomboid protease GluP
MANFLIKLKLIYLQFLIVAFAFIASYSFLVWLIVYQFSILDLNEDLIKFWLPFCLPAAPIYIWLRPRIKLIVLKDKRGNLPFLYLIAASFAISVPAIIAQEYLSTATGKLTIVNHISEINKKSITKYYAIKGHYIDKQHATIHRRTEVSGRNNEYLTFHLYVACPILDAAPQEVTGNDFKEPVAWLGTEYKKGISNHQSDAEKERAYKDLGTEAYQKFKDQNLDQFFYLNHIGNNSSRKGYYAAIKSIPRFSAADPVILEAVNQPFEARNGNRFGWIFKSFAIGAGIWLILLIFPKLDNAQVKKLPEFNLQNQWESFYKFTSSVKITKTLPVSIVIIGLNILVFVIMVFAGLGFISFDTPDLYA